MQTTLTTKLKSWLPRNPVSSRNRITRPNRRAFRPRIEALEDRTVLNAYTVNSLADSGLGSLRDAIIQANGHLGADTIVFDSGVSGTITLTSGEMDITDSLTITGPGASVLTVSGNDASRIFGVSSGVTASISGLSLVHGNVPNGNGGAIANFGTLTVSDSVFSYNGTGNGAGIYSVGTLYSTNDTFSHNTAGSGGGIYVENNGSVTVNSCTFHDNETFNGAGLHVYGGTAMVTNSTFYNNMSDAFGVGGGIYDLGNMTLVNCTITGNRTDYVGGGIQVAYGSYLGYNTSLLAINCTIAGNNARGLYFGFGAGGGINADYGTTVTLQNTIVAGNSALSYGPDIAGTAQANYCLIQNTSDWTPAAGSGNNILGVDPQLVSLAPNGGPTQTMALSSGSAAIDAGSDALVPNWVLTDQRGAGFDRIFGTHVDIGAFEFKQVNQPSTLSGFVWVDFNNDGQIDFGENGINGVTVTLAGTDYLGHSVSSSTTTDSNGFYQFSGLLPGSYRMTESQPAGYKQGVNVVGSAGGSVSGDVFSVSIASPGGLSGINYNFGEQPTDGSSVHKGQTAGIGFWNNKNGQALIKLLNGGASSTQLGNWLASTFVNIFGAGAGSNNLAGLTNAQVASAFQQRFVEHGPKLDAQIMATALSVYVTDSTLAGTVASAYGFNVTQYGLAIATFNVGSDGAAVGAANGSTMSVLDMLLAVDALSKNDNGVLYGGDLTLRNQANDLFSAINAAGNIG